MKNASTTGDGEGEAAPAAAGNAAVRLTEILARGAGRLLELQADTAVSIMSGEMRSLGTPTHAMSTIWRLPDLCGALFEQSAEHVRQSFRILSDMNNELVGLACDSVAEQGPVLAGVIAGANAALAATYHGCHLISS